MSLEKALAGLTASSEVTPTDVAMKMLDPSNAIMHTEINNPKVMNALLIAKLRAEEKGRLKIAKHWQQCYDAIVINMVSHKRKREGAIVKMFASLMAMFNQNGQQERKGGLFGNGGK